MKWLRFGCMLFPLYLAGCANYGHQHIESHKPITEQQCVVTKMAVSELKLLLFGQNITSAMAADICLSAGGVIADIYSAELNNRVVELLEQANFNSNLYPGAMINLTDVGKESKWLWRSGRPVSYSNWPVSESNGGVGANCAGIELARGGHQNGWWNDISCTGGYDAYPAVMCSIPSIQMVTVCW